MRVWPDRRDQQRQVSRLGASPVPRVSGLLAKRLYEGLCGLLFWVAVLAMGIGLFGALRKRNFTSILAHNLGFGDLFITANIHWLNWYG